MDCVREHESNRAATVSFKANMRLWQERPNHLQTLKTTREREKKKKKEEMSGSV